jgi:putative Mg2+ transporter-C (MgtC) family protein
MGPRCLGIASFPLLLALVLLVPTKVGVLVPQVLFELVLEPEDELADRTLKRHVVSLHMLEHQAIHREDGRRVTPTLEWWEFGLRLLGAAFLGGLIGFEREYHDQPAGFRTHILVTVGAALFTLVGAYGAAEFVGAEGFRFDPTRVAAQVVTGIGFLGAGAILRQGINVRGLTTAASIWVTASIGVAVALGFWEAGVITTAITLVSLLFLRPVQRVVLRSLRRSVFKIVVDLQAGGHVGRVNETLESGGVHVRLMRTVGEPRGDRQITLNVEVPSDVDLGEVLDRVRNLDEVSDVDWSR